MRFLKHAAFGLLLLLLSNPVLAKELPCLAGGCYTGEACMHHGSDTCKESPTTQANQGTLSRALGMPHQNLPGGLEGTVISLKGLPVGQPAGDSRADVRQEWLEATRPFRERLALPGRAP